MCFSFFDSLENVDFNFRIKIKIQSLFLKKKDRDEN